MEEIRVFIANTHAAILNCERGKSSYQGSHGTLLYSISSQPIAVVKETVHSLQRFYLYIWVVSVTTQRFVPDTGREFCREGFRGLLLTARFFLFLIPMKYQDRISPYHIITILSKKVMRIKTKTNH